MVVQAPRRCLTVANASKAGNWYPGTEGPDYLDGRCARNSTWSTCPVLRCSVLLMSQSWTRRYLLRLFMVC